MPIEYPFLSTVWRAQALNVVDGDTADLFVDVGFHQYAQLRFRFLDIDTAEMNSKKPELRAKALEAKDLVEDLLNCSERKSSVNLNVWPLRIESARDPDNFGRWLCRIFVQGWEGEISIGAELIGRELAVPYKK